ncbi:MAG: prolyl oligopeptidase family serine peptidase [Patescibacteria group bacterium]
MHTFRTRFSGDIIAEFLPPRRPSSRAIILCDGMPSVPSQHRLMEFFSKRGYWVFHPRYRGTWESGGAFLVRDPSADILDIARSLLEAKEIKSMWDGVVHPIHVSHVCVIGSSFGGTAALLASRDFAVDRVIAIAPVVDWASVDRGGEPMEKMEHKLRDAFGDAYRFSHDDWMKLKAGTFFSPVSHREEMKKEKIMIIHAADDDIVPIASVDHFAKQLQCLYIRLTVGGHLSKSIVMRWRMWWRVKKFFDG